MIFNLLEKTKRETEHELVNLLVHVHVHVGLEWGVTHPVPPARNQSLNDNHYGTQALKGESCFGE